MRLERLGDPNAVAKRAADAVALAIAARPDARIVLPAGATPMPLYAELRRRCDRGELDLSIAHLFQLDELVGVGPDDPRSFHAFLRLHLLGEVDRAPDRDHVLDGAAATPADEIARHAAALGELGGADLVLLGLGQNGHIAYNEPGSTVQDGARVVDLDAKTRDALIDAFGADAAPHRGLTLGFREILAARKIVLLVTGASKANVLRHLLTATPTPWLPASLILSHPSLTIVVDAPAFADPIDDGA